MTTLVIRLLSSRTLSYDVVEVVGAVTVDWSGIVKAF